MGSLDVDGTGGEEMDEEGTDGEGTAGACDVGTVTSGATSDGCWLSIVIGFAVVSRSLSPRMTLSV